MAWRAYRIAIGAFSLSSRYEDGSQPGIAKSKVTFHTQDLPVSSSDSLLSSNRGFCGASSLVTEQMRYGVYPVSGVTSSVCPSKVMMRDSRRYRTGLRRSFEGCKVTET